LKKDEAEASVDSRPDISYGVSLISRFMQYIYLKGMLNYGVLFPNNGNSSTVELVGYSDSDWCGDKDERRSTMGYVFNFLGAPLSWSSKKQEVVALSSCEAEYIAAGFAASQAFWLMFLLEEIKLGVSGIVQLFVDNKSAITLSENLVAHGRYKHIEAKYHFLRDQVNKGRIDLCFWQIRRSNS